MLRGESPAGSGSGSVSTDGNRPARRLIGRSARSPVRRQTGIANLVEERTIADAEGASGLLPVPVMGLQNFKNDLALQLPGRLSRQLLQGNGAVQVDLGVEELLPVASHQLGRDYVLAA